MRSGGAAPIRPPPNKRRRPWQSTPITTRSPAFERTSKRRKGYPSETRVKRGVRSINGGAIELLEKLGRNDPCPCGSGKRFQTLLPRLRPVSTARSGGTIGDDGELALNPLPIARLLFETRAGLSSGKGFVKNLN